MMEAPTEKQVAFLKKKNCEVPATKAEASQVISGLIGNSGKSYPSKERQQTVLVGANEATVKWEDANQETIARYATLLMSEQNMESLAVHITSSLHPTMSRNSQTFGMIVSAKEDKLIRLLKIQELRNISEQLSQLKKD